MVTFNNNSATNGTVYAEYGSNLSFKTNCKVTFSDNSVTQLCAAIYSSHSSHVTFTENSTVTFVRNIVVESSSSEVFGGFIYGGIICSVYYSYITVTGNSTVV